MLTKDEIFAIQAAISSRLAYLSSLSQNDSIKEQFDQLAKANEAFRRWVDSFSSSASDIG